MASVTYKNVTKRFGDVVAVKDLDIHIEDKEFLVFVGPSGCGKSTSLRLLAGLDEITEGEILIGDRVVNDVPPKDRDIAMVFQSYALYPHMDVYDNMAFGLKLRGTPKQEIKRRVEKAADILGMHNLLDRKPKQLSGGQRQRVAVGRAIVREPNVFLMDEPLSNLDAKLRVQARAEISKLHRRLETTFIYVTHDQVEAMTMGTRIAVLNDGILQQLDTPQDLYDYPSNIFVAGFIGSPSMNFFDGELIERDGRIAVETREFILDIPEYREPTYRPHLGQEIVFGVRPEDIHDPDFAPPDISQQLVEAEVNVTELMGDEVVVYLQAAEIEFLGRFDPRTNAKVGKTMSAAFNMDCMHIFDKMTEKAIRDKAVR
ncbi:MAG: ABC transporter ATP-binding protein [Chloroflexota bacterium]|nr:ABC transporter ATP-binding protein [Chloroflexota bacterium]